MKRQLCAFALWAGFCGVACGEADPPYSPVMDVMDDEETATIDTAEQALTYRYCASRLDCASGCMCSSNQCVPNGFGPPNPDCGAPPVRSCTTAANCRSSCVCSGGTCQPDGFSPPNPYCYLPPPDSFESDNGAAQAKNYMGTPQTHTFHQLGDEDWVLVYFGPAGQAKFETYNLQNADTELFVYTYVNGQAGTLVGRNDNWCTYSQSPTYCWPSKASVNVPANSLYLVRVINKFTDGHNVYNQNPPSYSLRIYY